MPDDTLLNTLLQKATSIGAHKPPKLTLGEMPLPKWGAGLPELPPNPVDPDITRVGQGIQRLMDQHGPDWLKHLQKAMEPYSHLFGGGKPGSGLKSSMSPDGTPTTIPEWVDWVRKGSPDPEIQKWQQRLQVFDRIPKGLRDSLDPTAIPSEESAVARLTELLKIRGARMGVDAIGDGVKHGMEFLNRPTEEK